MAITKEWLEEQIKLMDDLESPAVQRYEVAGVYWLKAQKNMREAKDQLDSIRVVRKELLWELNNLKEKETVR